MGNYFHAGREGNFFAGIVREAAALEPPRWKQCLKKEEQDNND